MRRQVGSILGSVALIAGLAGCHRDQKATGHGTVSGQILPGSVSDAMLPYDSVKSKAPLAPVQSIEQAGNAPDDTGADSADTAAVPDSAVADTASSPAAAVP